MKVISFISTGGTVNEKTRKKFKKLVTGNQGRVWAQDTQTPLSLGLLGQSFRFSYCVSFFCFTLTLPFSIVSSVVVLPASLGLLLIELSFSEDFISML